MTEVSGHLKSTYCPNQVTMSEIQSPQFFDFGQSSRLLEVPAVGFTVIPEDSFSYPPQAGKDFLFCCSLCLSTVLFCFKSCVEVILPVTDHGLSPVLEHSLLFKGYIFLTHKGEVTRK